MGPSAGEAPRNPATPFRRAGRRTALSLHGGPSATGHLAQGRRGPLLSSPVHGDFEAGQLPAGSVGSGWPWPAPRGARACSARGPGLRCASRSARLAAPARRAGGRWPRHRAPRQQSAHVMTTETVPGTAVRRSRQTGFGNARIGPRPRDIELARVVRRRRRNRQVGMRRLVLERLPPVARDRRKLAEAIEVAPRYPDPRGRTAPSWPRSQGVPCASPGCHLKINDGCQRRRRGRGRCCRTRGVNVGPYGARGAASRAPEARGTRASARTVGTPRAQGARAGDGDRPGWRGRRWPRKRDLLVRLARDLRC